MAPQITRRHFVQATAAATAGYWVAAGVEAKASPSAIERVQFGCIGIGGKGSSDTADAGKNGDVVGICDTDAKRLKGAQKRYKDAEAFQDFREMLDTMGDRIDAVTVSTPDHTHAVAASKAMSMGKHCFCQKPLTHSIYEARYLGDLAKSMGVATQMGNQGTAANGIREAAAIVKAGALGAVKEVHVWTNRPVWPQGGARPTASQPPADLDWNVWLGPAPLRPYGKGYHPFAWRGWWDFGTGALGDMACHTFNLPFAALNLRDPISVQAECSGHNGDSYPKWSKIHFVFPELDGRQQVDVYWYDGGKRPDPSILPSPSTLPDPSIVRKNSLASGTLIVGERGTLFSPQDYGDKFALIGDIEKPQVDFDRSPGHFKEWVRAIQGGPPAMSNFANYAGPLTETILLGNLSVWAAAQGGTGKLVEWDARNLVATNAPELASIVKRPYREDWELAAPLALARSADSVSERPVYEQAAKVPRRCRRRRRRRR